jgi:hypothetical protein
MTEHPGAAHGEPLDDIERHAREIRKNREHWAAKPLLRSRHHFHAIGMPASVKPEPNSLPMDEACALSPISLDPWASFVTF